MKTENWEGRQPKLAIMFKDLGVEHDGEEARRVRIKKVAWQEGRIW
jgi:hypothetical protein